MLTYSERNGIRQYYSNAKIQNDRVRDYAYIYGDPHCAVCKKFKKLLAANSIRKIHIHWTDTSKPILFIKKSN